MVAELAREYGFTDVDGWLLIVPFLSSMAIAAPEPAKSDKDGQSFLELELGLARVYEAELAIRMLTAKVTVSLHRRSAVRALVQSAWPNLSGRCPELFVWARAARD